MNTMNDIIKEWYEKKDNVAEMEQWNSNGLWCAAFVYHCVILAGFKILVCPKESSCSLAGCVAWEEWAQADYIKNAIQIFKKKGGYNGKNILSYGEKFCWKRYHL